MYNFEMSKNEMIATVRFFRNIAIRSGNKEEFEKYDILLQALQISPVEHFQNDGTVHLIKQGVSILVEIEVNEKYPRPLYAQPNEMLHNTIERMGYENKREALYETLTPDTSDWDEARKHDAFVESNCKSGYSLAESWKENILAGLL